MPATLDVDGNRVQDVIDDRVTSARTVLRQRASTPEVLKIAQTVLEEPVPVEFLFSQQITQAQIDTFAAAGGEFHKVFEAVSYGWTGTVPAGKAEDIAAAMGDNLLGIIEGKPVELHLDEATRTGRVRPVVWDAGVLGDGAGTDRVTVAILDSGVDGSHTDLSGRMEYWKDWTTDNHLSSQDAGHHGSHVAGIAVGSGAAYNVTPGQLKYTDKGNFATLSGSFFPSPIHLPATVSSATWNSSLRWQTGAGVGSVTTGHIFRSGPDWFSHPSLVITGGASSPINFASGPFANPLSGSWTFGSYVTRDVNGASTPAYAMTHTVTYGNLAADAYSPMSGVSPVSRWAGLKVFADSGSGSSLDIHEALDDIVAKRSLHNIKVANMSLGIVGSGGPGIDTILRNKTNTAAANGIVVVASAGNSGNASSGPPGETNDPGRAEHAITVVSSSDVNQVTDYSSHGFSSPGDANAGDQDMKPDICAPGGSVSHQSNILSVDSNTGDGGGFVDGVANDYLNIQGTSMASPFLAGCAALVIDAMQRSGETWDFSGAGALQDVLRVKSVLLMTATETNKTREASASGNPTLQRGGKDINEGYGIVNADAAVEAFMNPMLNAGVAAGDTFLATDQGRRCWARRVKLTAGSIVDLDLDCPVGGDYDLYLFAQNPDAYGNPVILQSSVVPGNDVGESLNYNPVATQTGYLVVKRVSGTGAWTLGGSAPVGLSEYTLE